MLNEAQERSLSVTLQIVEDRLREMETSIKSADYFGIVSEKINDVPFEARPALIGKAGLVRERIRILVEKFHLGKKHTGTAAETFARLAYCLEILEDARTKHLKRFGDTAPGLQEVLDPQIDAIINILSEIERLLRGVKSGK